MCVLFIRLNLMSIAEFRAQREVASLSLPSHPDEYLDIVEEINRVRIDLEQVRLLRDLIACCYLRWFV